METFPAFPIPPGSFYPTTSFPSIVGGMAVPGALPGGSEVSPGHARVVVASPV